MKTYFKAFMLLISILLPNCFFAQKVPYYSIDGNSKTSLSEHVDIKLIQRKKDKEDEKSAGAIIGAVAIPIFNITSTIVKEKIKNNQKKFIATYSGSAEFNNNELAEVNSLILKRIKIERVNQELNNPNDLLSDFTFTLKNKNGVLNIALDSVLMNYSKAKIRKHDYLSALVNVKVKAIKLPSKSNKELKTIEGEGNILVPVISVNPKNKLKLESPSSINFYGIDISNIDGLQLSISITETNITKLDASIIQSLLENNSEDFHSFIDLIVGKKEE